MERDIYIEDIGDEVILNDESEEVRVEKHSVSYSDDVAVMWSLEHEDNEGVEQLGFVSNKRYGIMYALFLLSVIDYYPQEPDTGVGI